MAADEGVNVGDGYIEIHPDLDNAKLAAIEAALRARLGAAGDDVRVKLNDSISQGLGDDRNFDAVNRKIKVDLPRAFETAGNDSSRSFSRGFSSLLSDTSISRVFEDSGRNSGHTFSKGFFGPLLNDLNGNNRGVGGSAGGGGNDIFKKLVDDAGDSGDKSGKSFGSRMRMSTTSVFGEANGILGFLTSPVGLGIAAGIGVTYGSAIGAAVVASLGLGSIGLAFLALHNDPNIQAGLSAIGDTVITEGKKLSEPFRQPFIQALDVINDTIQKVMPEFAGALTVMANAVKPLAEGLSGFLEMLQPGLTQALINAEPIVEQMSKELPGLGKAIGDFFLILSKSQGEVDGMRILFKTLEGILYGVAYTLYGLGAALNAIIIAGRATFNFYNDTFLPLFWSVARFFEGPFIAPFLAVADFFQGSFLTPFKTVVSFFTGSFLFPFELIQSFFAGSFLTPFEAVGNFFQGSFLTPFKTVASFFTGTFLTPFQTVANFFTGPFVDAFVLVGTTVSNIAQGAFNTVLLPTFRVLDFIFHVIIDGLKFLRAAFELEFEAIGHVVAPFIDGLVAGFNKVVDILTPFVNLFIAGLAIIAGKFQGFYNAVIKPELDLLVEGFTIIWNTVVGIVSAAWERISSVVTLGAKAIAVGLLVIVGGIVLGWQAAWGAVSDFFVARWNTIVNTFNLIMNTIKDRLAADLRLIQFIWNAAWLGVSTFVSERLEAVRTTINIILGWITSRFTQNKNEVTGVWGILWGGVRDTAVNTFNAVASRIQQVLDNIVKGFRIAKDGIADIWGKIVDVVKAPVNFIIDPIYDAGIAKVFNTIAEKAGIKERLPHIDRFAEGGPIHGPGGPKEDKVPIWASPGEYIVNAASTAKHLPLLRAINNNQQAPGNRFDLGGLIGDIGKAIGEGAKDTVHFTRGLLSGAASLAFTPVRKMLDLIPGSGLIREGTKGLGNKAIDGILEWIRGDDAAHFIPDGLAFSGVGSNSVAAIIELASRSKIPYNVTSTVRNSPQPGQASDYHMTGNAVDFASSPANMNRLADYFMKYSVDMLELIHSPSWYVKKGRNVGPGYYGADIVAQHFNHVHAAMTNTGVAAAEGKLGKQSGFAGNAVFAGAAGKAQVDAWIAQSQNYVPIEWIQGLETLIFRESGGNPNARNLSDTNAQQGDPSVGLMQVIGATFRQYRDKRLPDSQTNPIANIVAGMNYVHGRYGSLFNVQQAHAELPPKGYARGGLVKLFDRGGTLDPGMNLVMNATGKPETLRPTEQGVTVNVYVQDERLRDLIRVEVEDSHNELSSVIGSGRRSG